MEQILKRSFAEKKFPHQYIGEKFTCEHCGVENTVEDFISVIPGMFYVSSSKEASKHKSNQELNKFIESEDKTTPNESSEK